MYSALALWLGRLPGGLLHTNIGCCALFAATSGSSVATAATIGTVALPALGERNYPMPQALGSLAAGGTLGILIPPSVNLLVYGSLTNTSIGQLFAAGIVPGILLTLVFMGWIALSNLGDRGVRGEGSVPLAERLRALVHLVPAVVIFTLVMGSIYFGLATPTESAALGVVGALLFVWHSGRLSLDLLQHCFMQTARTTGMVLLIITGAFVLNVTLALLGVAQAMTAWVASFGLSATALLFALILFYLVLGMFMNVLSMQVLTIPIAVPVVTAVGVDPIWFGIFVVLMCELGLITPPVGMNLYVVQGVRGRGTVAEVIAGVTPFLICVLALTALIAWLPEIVMWLPRLQAR
jgi:tripartite ATP-independent transporter DctM subunit